MQNTFLSNNEQLMMEIFWKHDGPFTGRELKEFFPNWNYSYIVNMLTKLEAKNMLEECGTISYGTGRARKFIPAVSRADLVVSYIRSFKISSDQIPDVITGILRSISGSEKELQERKSKLIEALEKYK